MPRPRTNALFELGGQWIAAEQGTSNLYRFWNDEGAGRTCRETLGTSNLESAKIRLAEIVIFDAQKNTSAHLAVVLEKYCVERTDKKPSGEVTRKFTRGLLTYFGEEARVSSLTEEQQRKFVNSYLERGCKTSYVARLLSVLAAAISFAKIDADIVATEAQMESRWGITLSEPRKARIPTDKELAALLSYPIPEKLRRFIIIDSALGGRPETAIDLTPAQRNREAGVIDLKLPGVPQVKGKYKPTVRVPQFLAGWLDEWEADTVGMKINGGRYCGYDSADAVRAALKQYALRTGTPRLTPYSFRHKNTTVLRLAHTSEDEISVQLGHKRPHLRTTAGYGEWDPTYLAGAAAALDEWFRKLQALATRPLFSQGSPNVGDMA
jgi:integrase